MTSDPAELEQAAQELRMLARRRESWAWIASTIKRCGPAVLEVRDGMGQTALMHAARNTRGVRPTKIMLAAGAQVDAQDNEGNTALHSAGSTRIAQLLLKAGANIDLVNRAGQTAEDRAPESMQEMFRVERAARDRATLRRVAGVDTEDPPKTSQRRM
jgi:hypothetical protein